MTDSRVKHKFSKSKLKEYFKYHRDGYFIRLKQSGSGKPGDIVRGTLHHSGYLKARFLGKQCSLHRLIWIWHFGDTKKQIDHKDRDKANCKINNLREATQSQNSFNTKIHKHSTTGHRGIYKIKDSNSWAASIMVNGKRLKLGQSTSLAKAILLYEKAAKYHAGEFYGK